MCNIFVTWNIQTHCYSIWFELECLHRLYTISLRKTGTQKIRMSFLYALQIAFLGVYRSSGNAFRWMEFRSCTMKIDTRERKLYTPLCLEFVKHWTQTVSENVRIHDIFDFIGIMSCDILWAFRWFSFSYNWSGTLKRLFIAHFAANKPNTVAFRR